MRAIPPDGVSGTIRCEFEVDAKQLDRAIKRAQAIVKAGCSDVETAKEFLPFAFRLRDALRLPPGVTLTRREPRR